MNQIPELESQELYNHILRQCIKIMSGGVDHPDIWLDSIAYDFILLDERIRSGDIPSDWK